MSIDGVFTVRHDAGLVQLIVGGRLVMELHPMAAQALRDALGAKQHEAEEQREAERIAFDSAILLRAGSNFGLSRRADILDEARKEAAWNGNLRRYMPGGVKSREAFGTPAVIRHEPHIVGAAER